MYHFKGKLYTFKARIALIGFILQFSNCYANVVRVWYRPIRENKDSKTKCVMEIFPVPGNCGLNCMYSGERQPIFSIQGWIRDYS